MFIFVFVCFVQSAQTSAVTAPATKISVPTSRTAIDRFVLPIDLRARRSASSFSEPPSCFILPSSRLSEAMSRRFKTKLERFEKDAASMSEAERVNERRELAEMERDVTRRSREAREEFNQRRNEEVLLLQNRAARIIQDVSRREHFDLVLYEFFYASDRIDLTKRVIDELDRSTLNEGKKK